MERGGRGEEIKDKEEVKRAAGSIFVLISTGYLSCKRICFLSFPLQFPRKVSESMLTLRSITGSFLRWRS